MSHTVFVYGTLKRGQPNHSHMTDSKGHCTFLGTAELQGRMPMVIASSCNIPFLLPVNGQGEHVFGELYEVDDDKLNYLDCFEGHPHYYERSQISVNVLTGYEAIYQSIVWCYILRKFKPEMLSLPFLRDYDSNGDHGRPYNVDEDINNCDDIEI